MIQDILPYHLNNHYESDVIAEDNDFVVVFSEKKLLLQSDKTTNSIRYPLVSDLSSKERASLIYLFGIDDEKFFLLPESDLLDDTNNVRTALENRGFSYYGIRELRGDLSEPKRYVYAAYTAYQLAEWYEVTQFCGRCGTKNTNDSTERARVCPTCGNKIYPRINPAVIIGVIDRKENKMVLTKYRSGYGHNALVAGFTEIGETLEGTVEREVMEEVGLHVTNIRYYKSQPWGIASDILAGFFCDADGDTTIRMDESELRYAEWVSPEDIVLQPTNYSLTNEMMRLFKEKGCEGI